MQKEMDVGVDEAGHEGERAEVYDFCAGGMRDGGSGRCDAVAFDEDFAGRGERAVLDVEQVRGVEDYGWASGVGDWLGGDGIGGLGEQRERQEDRCQ